MSILQPIGAEHHISCSVLAVPMLNGYGYRTPRWGCGCPRHVSVHALSVSDL
ncbi:hypothetical protein T4D_10616 [Trichinella pseudospiralis]|uniref:Uncharacterized protein n=1 Tax=Trichinella pseudospiralis TaxID=6337 RepID=A0A0V1DSR3_TRIPS|nr:hypothetical protein T4D_10616 [Trichinella pseudospiralis]